MKIEIEYELNVLSDYEEEIGRVVIDGVKDRVSEFLAEDLFIKSPETFNQLTHASFIDLKKIFHSMHYLKSETWCEYPIYITISYPVIEGEETTIQLTPQIDYLSWNKHYPVNDLVEVYRNVSNTVDGVRFVDLRGSASEPLSDIFGIEVLVKEHASKIRDLIDSALEKLREIHQLSLDILNSRGRKDSLSTLFDFPPEIRPACNQYLMYFGQFLEDLGINVETSLKEQANQVLFTVTPKDKNQALDVIHKALTSYLELSDVGAIERISGKELAVMQLKANVYHLRSQLELSNALIQAKEETISALKLSNYQLQTFIPQNVTERKTDSQEEKVLGGIVSIKKYEGKGFSIDLAEILRKLKRRFR